jgi:hypothetical protein
MTPWRNNLVTVVIEPPTALVGYCMGEMSPLGQRDFSHRPRVSCRAREAGPRGGRRETVGRRDASSCSLTTFRRNLVRRPGLASLHRNPDLEKQLLS